MQLQCQMHCFAQERLAGTTLISAIRVHAAAEVPPDTRQRSVLAITLLTQLLAIHASDAAFSKRRRAAVYRWRG